MKDQPRYLFGADARVLLALLENGRVNRSAFKSKHKISHDTAINSLRFLRDRDLVDFEELGDFKDTQIWFLTEKGEVAAQKLSELVEFIDGE